MSRDSELITRGQVLRLFSTFYFMCYLYQAIQGHDFDSSYCQNGTVVLSDFRGQNLTSVPAEIPLKTTMLVLSDNRLTAIKDFTFHRLQYLQKLYLSNNQINTLEPRSFFGLHNLCHLDLSRNPLAASAFPTEVFSAITNLRVLKLDRTFDVKKDIYPDQAFRYLVNVRRLSLSALSNLRFGPGFGSMTKLEDLQIVGGVTRAVYNNTFNVFSNTSLRQLSLKDCDLKHIELGVFTPLKQLQSLDLSRNLRMTLSLAMQSLFALQYRNMTDIILQHINADGNLRPLKDFILDKEKSKYLGRICVSHLDLGDNAISFIEQGFFSSFLYPHCLRKLSLRNHRLTSVSPGVYEILRFTELQYFDVKASCRKSVNSLTRWKKSVSSRHVSFVDLSEKLTISVLPNVTYADLSCVMDSWGDTIQIANTKKLLFLDLSYNGLTDCRIPFLDTLSIKVLNISGSDCSSLPMDLLNNFSSLEVLEMNNFNLNLGLLNDVRGVLLRNQLDLKNLSMAGNGLANLHKDLFVNQTLTTALNLANNKLGEIPPTVRNMVALKFLDMSYNAITFLGKSDRIWLENMSKKTNISVALEGNPFSCICSTVEFTQWLLETSVNVVAKQKLRCTVLNGTVVDILALKEALRDFEIECKSKFWLTFSVTTASVMCAGLILSIIGYRYRYNIKYWILTKCKQPRNYQVLPVFDYDAFVAYNHHDYRWVCHRLRGFLETQRGYRLCLHHRDFLAGESIQQNIVDAINTSRKTILVISLEFLRCDWGEFEIQMAGMRMVQEGRENVVVVILLEDISVGQMPRSLINMWKNITFLLWSEEPGDEALFWERLDQSLRSDIETDPQRSD